MLAHCIRQTYIAASLTLELCDLIALWGRVSSALELRFLLLAQIPVSSYCLSNLGKSRPRYLLDLPRRWGSPHEAAGQHFDGGFGSNGRKWVAGDVNDWSRVLKACIVGWEGGCCRRKETRSDVGRRRACGFGSVRSPLWRGMALQKRQVMSRGMLSCHRV